MTQRFFSAVGLILLPFFITAQVKFEKEIRIKKKCIPTEATDFINAIDFIDKVKWYQEYSLKDTTFEAKTKHHHSTYSIEFTLLGKVEDIEQTIGWEAIATSAQAKILSYLKQEHTSTKIQKIQVQYSGDEKDLLLWMNKKERAKSMVLKYEIILTAETDRRKQQIEYLFSEQGVMEKKAFFLFKNSDNLEY